MKKRKIIAIWLILLLITIPIGIAQASETYNKEQNIDTVTVELISIESDGIISTNKMILSEEELVIIENTITLLIEKIQSVKSWQELKTTIINILGQSNSALLTVIASLFESKGLSSRAFVISSGQGFRLNPLRKNQIKIRKQLSFWHYSSGELLNARTIILKPLALKLKTLKGLQVGAMTRFTGIYFSTSRNIPQKSYTFFLGTAARINGIQLEPS